MMNGTYIEGVSDKEGKKFSNTPDRLYKNNGNGKFTEVSKSAGLDDRNWSMAAGAIDYDNDGDQDLYLLNYGPNVFFVIMATEPSLTLQKVLDSEVLKN